MDCRARLRKQVRRAKRVATRDSKSNDIPSQPSGGCYPDVPAWVTTLFVAKVSINRQQGNASPQDFPIGSATGHQQRFVCSLFQKGKGGAQIPEIQLSKKMCQKSISLPLDLNLEYNKSDYDLSKKFVDKNFADNYGDVIGFNYPINHKERIPMRD